MAKIVLALDLPDRNEALRFLDQVPALEWVKVGPALMSREGGSLIRDLRGRGLKVFLDLKWHDIPNTVAGAVTAAADLAVTMATVHTLGGAAMLKAAVQAGGSRCALIGVTVLTSHDAASYSQATGRSDVDLSRESGRLASVAMESGLGGVVCSPREAAAVRQRIGPEPWIVVPGIRRSSDPADDQVRTATPAEATRAGATHLVVGRPLLRAPAPAAALAALAEGAR
jgi:orotidine-5'-phosphate decarboxylase